MPCHRYHSLTSRLRIRQWVTARTEDGIVEGGRGEWREGGEHATCGCALYLCYRWRGRREYREEGVLSCTGNLGRGRGRGGGGECTY